MSGRGILALLLGLAGISCDETVGFLSLELEVPTRTPPIACAKDPRRVVSLTLRAECDGATLQTVHALEQGTSASISLAKVPLGSCTLEVQGKNVANRVVLSGKEAVSVARGENPPLKISLLEARCEEKSCDADGDGLADVDEPGLGLSASRADSDGDGLSDGLELMQCCTDPLLPGGQPCKLLIQSVQPLLGVVGESVLIKASNELKGPQVELGRVALAEPLADGSIVFGRVGQGAVLGEVRLTAAGASDSYADLFAVLREPAESVAELDQRAGGKVGLMQQLVDAVSLGDVQLLLGAAPGAPVLIVSDRRNNHGRLVLQAGAKPVAVAGAEKLAVALLRDASEVTTIQPVELAPVKARTALKGLVKGAPVSIAIEAGGQTALVLYRDAVQRIRLDDPSGASAAVTLANMLALTNAGSDPNAPALAEKVSCTGMSYRPVKTTAGVEGWLFVACSAPPLLCPPGAVCEDSANVLRLGPLEKCLPLDGKQPPAAVAGGNCWARVGSKGFGRGIGAPVIDEAGGQVYQLTAAGVAAAPLAGFQGGLAGIATPLIPIFPLQVQGKLSSPRAMALDGAGRLFAADGPRVWRIEVRQPDPKRPARPLWVGREGEEALSVGLSADGTVLDLGRVREGSLGSVARVCLERCQGCLCAP
jgi:hypothetical protein